ncbi:MAG: MFS transporter [Dehalococcoidia bacterium]|nr:MFS transporter [Dehalococcoidia bacterium]
MVAVQAGRPERRDRLAFYYGAKFLGQTAQNLFLATLFIVAGTSSSAAIDLSSLFVAVLIPAVAFGPIGGAIVDKVGPARGYVIGASLRLAVVGSGLLLLDSSQPAWVFAFAYSAVSQVYSPSEVALIRTLQGQRSGIAHSLTVAIQYGGQGLGMLVLAPAAYFFGGAQAMLALATIGFVGVTALALVLGRRLEGTSAAQAQPAREAFALASTCRFFLQERRAGYAVVVLATKTIVSRAIVIALPFYIERDMGLGSEAVAFLLVPGVIGVGAGLLWAGRAVTLDRAHGTMRLSMLMMIASVFAFAVLDFGVTAVAHYSQVPPIVYLEASINTTFAVAIPVAFVLGLALTTSLIAARVALTETAPDGQQARVFAVEETLSEAMVVAPLLLAGIGTQFAGARPTLLVVGAVITAVFVVTELAGRARIPATRPAIPGEGVPAAEQRVQL